VLEAYKSFIKSDDLAYFLAWVSAIREDDLTRFLAHYDRNENPIDELFDVIEVVIAYEAKTIFQYFLDHEDYSHFYTPFNLSLLSVCAVFEQEDFLHMALAQWSFDDDDLLSLYDYVIQYESLDFFKRLLLNFPVTEEAELELLRMSLDQESMFYVLKNEPQYQQYLLDPHLVYDIVAYFPQYLNVIDKAKDLGFLTESDAFIRIMKFNRYSDFKRTIDFILKRGLAINSMDDFGFSLLHLALRHSNEAKYVEYLVALGADTNAKTSLGYAPAHQLMLRSARFTLEVSHLIDFGQKDKDKLTLHDYDLIDRRTTLNFEDMMRYNKVIFNLDVADFYELDEEEFYELSFTHGVQLFQPYMTLIEFETVAMKEAFIQRAYDFPFEMMDTEQLAFVFQTKFNHDQERTLQLMIDLVDVKTYFPLFQAFSDELETPVVISSEGYEINQMAQVEWRMTPKQPLQQKAVVYSHLVDVYYLHMYYKIALEDITYDPHLTQPKRYLS
jgi:hypothetical protein